MRIHLHIGLEHVGAGRLQDVLAEKREHLAAKGILFPRALGPKNHTRLFMAVTDPDHVDPLRFARGYVAPEKQAGLLREVELQLERDIAATAPRMLILSASQLGASLHRVSELERLHRLLSRFSNDIRIVAHVDEQGRLLARFRAAQCGHDGFAEAIRHDPVFPFSDIRALLPPPPPVRPVRDRNAPRQTG